MIYEARIKDLEAEVASLHSEVGSLHSEVERYKKGNDELKEMVEDMTEKYTSAFNEVERLKAALKNISVMYERWYSDGTVTDAGHIAYEMHACAASARKEGE